MQLTERQRKVISTGRQVAQLKKNKSVTYLNPVASERAEIMRKSFNYEPIVVDGYTLQPQKQFRK